VILVTGTALEAVAQQQYTVLDLGTLGGMSSAAFGINNYGQIVGGAYVSSGAEDAFLYANGMMVDLGPGQAYGISGNGQIVGAGGGRAFIYNAGTRADLGPGTAFGVNNSGQVALESTSENGREAFLYSGGITIDLGPGVPYAINDRGQLVWTSDPTGVGSGADLLYSNGMNIDLGAGQATAINNYGQVVGSDYGSAFLYSAGIVVPLPGLSGGSYPNAINNNGQVVGRDDGGAFLYSAGTTINLNDLIPANSRWTLIDATAINDNGQIVGYGVNPSGQEHAFLLSPPPILTGHVYCTCDSNAITGAIVQINGHSAITDSGGAYTLTNGPPSTYTALVSGNNYAPLTTNLTVPPAVPKLTNDFYLTNLTLVINPIFDATITADLDVIEITNSIKSSIQEIERYIANPMCVKVLFVETNTGLGANFSARYLLLYSAYIAALQNNANKSANDTIALDTMPSGPATGINGTTVVLLTAANEEAIGNTSMPNKVANDYGGFYGTVFLNITNMNLTRPAQHTNLYDLQSVAAHELDEVLGIGGCGSHLYLTTSYTGQASPTDAVSPLDFFRYSAPGARSFTLDPTATAYFSIDFGITTNVYFNQHGKGSDFGDWGGSAGSADGESNKPPQVQDAFFTPGAMPNLGRNELIALDVVGYTLLSAPPTIQNPTYAANTFTFDWTAVPGKSYQVQYATSLTGNVWNNLGDPITASDLTAAFSDIGASDSERYYQVLISQASVIPSLSNYRSRAIMTPHSLITNGSIPHYLLPARP